ncbi:hypothetical protein [Streptococcus dentiloxodontae]
MTLSFLTAFNLKHGQVYDKGTPSQVFTDNMLAQVFGICATICPIKNSRQVLCYDFRKNEAEIKVSRTVI